MNTVTAISLVVTILVISSSSVSAIKKATNPTVRVGDLGTAEGAYAHTAWTGRKYLKFIDLPYGETSYEKRFQPPKPVEEFDETYNAYTSDMSCPSLTKIDEILGYGQEYDFEDCLHLTISTPNKTASLPVMVYLAGYDLEDTENEDSEAEYLLEKDVVLVSVQFRGGPLGFLSTLSEGIPGNIGVLDVIEALRFVQKYIEFFGGDKKRVTLFGQYGNAALIHVLTMSPLIEKEELFQKVIYQSGSALMHGITSSDPLSYAKVLGKHLECKKIDDIAELNNCFKAADLAAILYAYRDVQKEYGKMPYFTVGGPSGVLPEEPKILLESGKFRSYPTMGGVVRNAAMGTNQIDNTENDYNHFITELEKTVMNNVKSEDYRNLITKQFPSQLWSKNLLKSIWPGVVDLHSLDIKESTSKALKYNCDKEKSYLYAFNYLGENNRLSKSEEDDFDDVSLTDDSIYLFPYRAFTQTLSKDDKHMAHIMVDLWTSFATDGVPTSSNIIGQWPPMVKEKMGPYMKLDKVPEIGYYYPDEFFTTVLETRENFTLE